MKQNIIKHRYILLALTVILIYLSPNIFLPHKARFVIHDNLDSNVLWFKNLGESGKMFASNNEIIPNSLGGIPRGCYPSEFNFLYLFYLWFPALFAYNLNIVLMHLVAFFSMYMFNRRFIFKGKDESLSVGVALLFALLPFWPSGGMAIAAQPMLLYAFLNILLKDLNWKNWLIIVLVPLYSLLVLSNLFFILTITLGFTVYCFVKRSINWFFVLALILFTLVSVIAEHRLITMQFMENFVSHRADINALGTLNLNGVIGVSLLHFLKGQYHFHSLQFPFVIFIAIVALIFTKEKKQRSILFILILSTYFISLVFVLPNWKIFQDGLAKFEIVNTVSLRFYSLAPLFWFIILSYSSMIISMRSLLAKRIISIVFVVMAVTTVFGWNAKDYFNSRYAENSFYNTYIARDPVEHASFEEFYNTKLFNEIKRNVPTGSYYIGCLGIHPEIAQFNGYNTIDGYFYYFSKSYFDKMYAINQRELQKDEANRLYSRCYLISNDITHGKKIIDDLSLDFDKMKALGTRYIFSDRKIVNTRLINEMFFENDQKALKVYVYTIV